MSEELIEAIKSLAPARRVEAITPDDTGFLRVPTRALFVGTGGNLKLQSLEGGEVVLKNVPSGCTLDVQVAAIRATGTTATDIVGLY